MSKHRSNSKDTYEVPIYLNQKVVFDIVATMNDGLSQIKRITTNESKESSVEGELGTKNIFALFGVSLSGGRTKGENSQREEEKIHTPSSLFNMMKEQLKDEGIVTTIKTKEDFDGISPGDFIEIEGVIEQNPIIEVLNSASQMLELATVFTDVPAKNAKKEKDENKKILSQIRTLQKGLQNNDMVDLICKTESDYSFKAVMPVYLNYFFNNNMNEIVDGKFKVFGKVTSKCVDRGISLMRNTGFTLVKKDSLEKIFKDMETTDEDIEITGMTTMVEPPAIIVMPIAIYI